MSDYPRVLLYEGITSVEALHLVRAFQYYFFVTVKSVESVS